MRLAILSDIHGNLEALKSVMEDIDRQQIDRIICLGDIVGYGADPVACVRMIRERASATVLGNHDAGVLAVHIRPFFNPAALKALEWTAAQLSGDDIRWLSSLPYTYSKNNMLYVHAAPRVPEQWEYVFSGMEARRYARYFHERLCFIGHSHVPGVYPLDPEIREYNTDSRFLINVGSVGQPRDGDWRACYGLLDSVSGSFIHVRVEYDVNSAMQAIIRAGLPKRLAERLKTGM